MGRCIPPRRGRTTDVRREGAGLRTGSPATEARAHYSQTFERQFSGDFVFHSIASAPSLSQRSLGRVTFVAAALLLAPLTAPESADAASTTPPVIKLGYDVYKGVLLSPNGDGSQDKARIRFTLASRSDVIVTVRRNNTDRTVVYRKKLGRLSGGAHAWQWNGKNPRGKPVRDGRYSAIFVADQVARAGKTSRNTANVAAPPSAFNKPHHCCANAPAAASSCGQVKRARVSR